MNLATVSSLATKCEHFKFRGFLFHYIKWLKKRHFNFEVLAFWSQIQITRSLYHKNQSWSGFPPSFIPALQKICILHQKKARLPKHLQHSVLTNSNWKPPRSYCPYMIIGIYCESASQSFHSLKTAAFGIKDKKSALLSPFFMTISLLKIIVAQEVHNGLKSLSDCLYRPWLLSTGKSLPDTLIFASTNPQYDDILFIQLQVQYVKIPSSEHGENMLCTEISTFRTICVHNMFSTCSAKIRASDKDLPVHLVLV